MCRAGPQDLAINLPGLRQLSSRVKRQRISQRLLDIDLLLRHSNHFRRDQIIRRLVPSVDPKTIPHPPKPPAL
jgi:7,8-dihydro-6-hydroxymethylpterin-pyrophosphokinase